MRMNRFWKGVAAVMAVALSVTLVPGQGRCDDMPRANVFMMVIELAQPKKQAYKKPAPAVVSPCCPGAAVMPCCPMAHAVTSTCVQVPACPVHKPQVVVAPRCPKPPCAAACVGVQDLAIPILASPCCPMVHTAVTCEAPCIPTQGPTCPACPRFKPEAVGAPCCERSGSCKAECAVNEMRALCAEQARTLHEMQFMIKSLQSSIEVLQGQVQTLHATEGSSAVPCKMPVVPKQESSRCLPFKVMPKPVPKSVVND